MFLLNKKAPMEKQVCQNFIQDRSLFNKICHATNTIGHIKNARITLHSIYSINSNVVPRVCLSKFKCPCGTGIESTSPLVNTCRSKSGLHFIWVQSASFSRKKNIKTGYFEICIACYICHGRKLERGGDMWGLGLVIRCDTMNA